MLSVAVTRAPSALYTGKYTPTYLYIHNGTIPHNVAIPLSYRVYLAPMKNEANKSANQRAYFRHCYCYCCYCGVSYVATVFSRCNHFECRQQLISGVATFNSDCTA